MDDELAILRAVVEEVRHHARATNDTLLMGILDGLPHECKDCRVMDMALLQNQKLLQRRPK